MSSEVSHQCPVRTDRDDRKSARIAAERITPEPTARAVRTFALARDIFRSSATRQVTRGRERNQTNDPTQSPVIFLDGEPHRSKRAAIARFFTPKAIATRYRTVMEQTTDALLLELRKRGSGRLDQMSFQLAVIVASDIIGLATHDLSRLASRIEATLSSASTQRLSWLPRPFVRFLQRYYALRFFYRDVRPAIAARRRQRRDDVISQLIGENYSERAILIECMTYAVAGMVTTREFIVMAAWHMFENEALRQRFLAADEDDQISILEEILRLEPVASMLYRRTVDAVELPGVAAIAPDTHFAIDIRAANTDEAATGPCPYALDPDRAKRMKTGGAFMSFGDGNHRCPGAQVALHESRTFLDRLFRVSGIRLERVPEMGWSNALSSYELRNAVVTCNRT